MTFDAFMSYTKKIDRHQTWYGSWIDKYLVIVAEKKSKVTIPQTSLQFTMLEPLTKGQLPLTTKITIYFLLVDS